MSGHGVSLRRGALAVDIDRRGAAITAFGWTGADSRSRPVMRESLAYAGDPLTAACFPLVPFGNRVRDNVFAFAGQEHRLSPNQPWDRHYLHGDGWLSLWNIETSSSEAVQLTLRHEATAGQPYAYEGHITYRLTAAFALEITLSLRNIAPHPMPFGLGLHPYFPLTAETELRAPADAFFPEEAEFLPGPQSPVPDTLDFNTSRTLPRHWINNGFSGWDGTASILWPEHSLALHIQADAAFRDYFIFMSDKRFEPSFRGDYFCFEPMTHHADAHHAADLGGLAVLAPGAVFTGVVSFTPQDVPASARSLS